MAVAYKDLELNVYDLPALNEVKKMANIAAFNLLFQLDTMVNKKTKPSSNVHTICTSESLTSGMIMSTLVDIPWLGLHKYGGFAVYNPDAKRVFNKVTVDDLYTHRCAKEMAIGVLKNSNATIAISATGNAMPNPDDADQLGEVFIGVAGYVTEGGVTKIVYNTMMMNACANSIPEFRKTCKAWHKIAKKNVAYNKRNKTALISQEIRHYTTYMALDFCLQFTKTNNLVVPDFVVDRIAKNSKTGIQLLHTDTPANKYEENITVMHVGDNKYNTATPNRHTGDTAQYDKANISTMKSSSPRKLSNGISSYEFLSRRNVFNKPLTRKASRSASITKSNKS